MRDEGLTMERPLTIWKERKHSSGNKDEGYVAWKKCKKCGKTDIVFISGDGNTDYVCKACKSKEEESGRSSTQEPELQELKSEVAVPILDSKKTRKKGGKRRNQVVASGISTNPKFAGLLPTYRIKCQKCGEEVPCHYSWYTQSTVLCPTCYGQMKEHEVREFHATHTADKPKFEKDTRPTYSLPKHLIDITEHQAVKIPDSKRGRWTRDSSMVNSGGCWTNSRIQGASASELKEAVRLGKVSKARFRIEMRRRDNVSYYDMCPEEVGISMREIF